MANEWSENSAKGERNSMLEREMRGGRDVAAGVVTALMRLGYAGGAPMGKGAGVARGG